jgi:hypothetical protein
MVGHVIESAQVRISPRTLLFSSNEITLMFLCFNYSGITINWVKDFFKRDRFPDSAISITGGNSVKSIFMYSA